MPKLSKLDESLMDAVRRGEIAEVRRHLLGGANANAADEQGRTPYHLAASVNMSNFRRKEILLELAKYRGNPAQGDALGMTPLHEAAIRADFDTMRFLVGKGADANAAAKDGSTPLHSAMKAALGTGKTETMKLLLDLGANSLLRDANGKTALDGARDKEGFTLFYATVIGFLADWERDKPAARRNAEYDAAHKDEQKAAAAETLKRLQDRARQQKNKFKL